ncbi:MAG: PAS domain S-box protein, partial [Thermodesulfobacteriota bacterium]|nr:PAS domain S-box protein [Thermodesulfobacteriota bacterium]
IRLGDIGEDFARRKEAEKALQKSRIRLERRVERRTAELKEANQRLRKEIMEREWAEKVLRAERDRVRKYMDIAGAFVLVVDAGGEVTLVNRMGCRILEYGEEEILGKHYVDFFIPERMRDEVRTILDQLAEEEAEPEEYHEHSVLTKTGREKIVHWRAAFLRDENGEITGVVVSGVDVTEQKKAEALREDVERITRHDLRNPLSTVIYVPQMLETDDNLTPNQLELLKKVEEAGYQMLNMIDSSLNLYKMEQGTYEPDPHPVDVLPLLKKIAEDLYPSIEFKGLGMDVFVRGSLACETDEFKILGEELLCYTMLANLIKNAVEASPDKERVRVSLDEEEDFFVVAIHNKGAVPEEIRDTLFEKYATSGKKDGTGLGAYSARLIAETLGGGINYTTSEEQGTTVTVRRPKHTQRH